MSKRRKHEPRTPRPARGGIRAQGIRSAGARRPWWGRRWLLMIESLRLGARLGRGRSYAITGQVTEFTLGEGVVGAMVQGGAATPYRVTLNFRTLDDASRHTIATALTARPAWLGRLLVNDLPAEIETFFRDGGVPLFPEPHGDWRCHCTCPDWAKPCKHVAAVFFLLGEAVESEPMLLLELRGLNSTDLIPEGNIVAPTSPEPETISLEPNNPDLFWGDNRQPATTFGPAPGQSVGAPLVTRLGPIPFWRGLERFRNWLGQIYERAAPVALRVWSGEDPANWRPRSSEPATGGFQPRHRRLRVDDSF